MSDRTIEMQAEGKEQLPVHVVDKLLGGKNKVRIALVEHPVTHELASCIPVIDYADAFSYDKKTIFKMIDRTPWLKKYSGVAIMATPDGQFQKHRVIFEESALGVFMKLQPNRCKDSDVGAKIDALQEELMLILHDTLKGYRTGHNDGYGYNARDGFLPRPGLSMDAISGLCREADRCLKGKASLRALTYFTGMPTDDLAEEIETMSTVNSTLAGTMLQYLTILLSLDTEKFEITKAVSDEGNQCLDGEGRSFFKAFLFIQKQEKFPKFFNSVQGLAMALNRETSALEYLGVRRTVNHHISHGGYRHHRFEFLKQKES
jgi:hypothetical protein